MSAPMNKSWSGHTSAEIPDLLTLFPSEGVRPTTKLMGHMVAVFIFYFSEGMPYCFAVLLIYISPKRV